MVVNLTLGLLLVAALLLIACEMRKISRALSSFPAAGRSAATHQNSNAPKAQPLPPVVDPGLAERERLRFEALEIYEQSELLGEPAIHPADLE